MTPQREIESLFVQHPRLWIVAAVGGLWISIVWARKVFGGWSGFLEALRYWFQPGWLSMFRGEFWEDTKAEFKLFIWLIGAVLVTLALKLGLTKLVVMYSLAERFGLPI